MGAYFSNIHIKNESITEGDVRSWVLTYFLEKGFVEADRDTADLEVSILASEEKSWISVYCDGFAHTDILDLCPRFSQMSGNDVLGISCIDSDYLFLNLCNVGKGRDLWLNIGESPELKKPRRTNLSAWKSSVKNMEAFSSAAKKKYTFAEDFLLSVRDEFDLSFEQSTGFDIPDNVSKLYFSAPQKDTSSPTKLQIPFFSMEPCQPGERQACIVNNVGDASKGIAVLFVGDYVENDEITIDDASFFFHDRRGADIEIPIDFVKTHLTSGQWAYYWSDKDFKISSAVPQNLPPQVRSNKEFLRSFGIRYTPNGNKRKFLDITVVFAPLSNWRAGQCSWRVWRRYSSKREFIEAYNRNLDARFIPNIEEIMLDPDEYDLD